MTDSQDTKPPRERDATLTDREAQLDRDAARGDAAVADRDAPADLPGRDDSLPVRADDRYQRGELHGQGGLGRVLLAYDRDLQRTVALKELRYPNPAAEARFVREARITARLEHPAIVPVHDAGRRADGQPYYAMKLVAGRTLRDAIAAAASLGERLGLLPNLLDVAEAVAYAHSRGVIHRDLKPGNVVLGEFGETVVIDWGLAKELGEADDAQPATSESEVDTGDAVTRAGEVLGTPAYMAPEQARGEAVDTRADVYALGAVLYHLLAGEPAFGPGESRDVLDRLLDGPPPPIAERAPKTAPELVAIVDKAMARATADRYRDAAGLRDDLRRFQTGRLVEAHRYTLRQRTRRFASRHRGALAALGLGSIAVIATYTLVESGARGPSCELPPSALASSLRARDSEITAAIRQDAAAGAAWRAAASAMEGYAAALDRARAENCRATHVLGEQSIALLDARTACLRLREIEAGRLLEIAAGAPTRDGLLTAARAVSRLSPIETCNDTALLTQVAPRPSEPAARAAVDELEADISKLRAELVSERRELADRARDLNARAKKLGYEPARAEALLSYSTTLLHSGEHENALDAAREAALAAERANATDLRINAELLRARIEGTFQDRPAPALEAVDRAEAALARVERPRAKLRAISTRAEIAVRSGRREQALSLARDAVERAVALFGANHEGTARERYRLGFVLLDSGHNEEAVVELRTALETRTELFGSNHPLAARTASYLGTALAGLGDLPEAERVQRRALDSLLRIHDEVPHIAVIAARVHLASTLKKQSSFAAAHAQLATALAEVEALYGPRADRVGDVLENLSSLESRRGNHDAAIAAAERAVAIRLHTGGEDNPVTAFTIRVLGRRYAAAKKWSRARQEHARSLAILRRMEPGTAPRMLVRSLLDLAEVLLERKAYAEAEQILTRDLARVEAHLKPFPPRLHAALYYLLGQARARGGSPGSLATSNGRRALELAERADATELADDIRRWLADEREAATP